VAVGWTALTWSLCFASLGLIRPGQAAEPTPSLAPEEVFERTFVAFDDQVLVIYSAGRRPSRMWTAYRGKYRSRLPGADFYLAIDRPDLASAYRRRHAAELSLIFGGIGATLGGLYLGGRGWLTAGAVLVTAGLGGILAGWILEPDPVNESEAREAADVYNKKLKRRLGLVGAGPPAGAPKTAFSWAPIVTTVGGGIQFGHTF
jgi:hypothetical protein